MKKFIVIESTLSEYQNEFFEIDTRIKQNVIIPFCTKEWRCVMFDGIRVQLTNDNDIIIGSLM